MTQDLINFLSVALVALITAANVAEATFGPYGLDGLFRNKFTLCMKENNQTFNK